MNKLGARGQCISTRPIYIVTVKGWIYPRQGRIWTDSVRLLLIRICRTIQMPVESEPLRTISAWTTTAGNRFSASSYPDPTPPSCTCAILSYFNTFFNRLRSTANSCVKFTQFSTGDLSLFSKTITSTVTNQ